MHKKTTPRHLKVVKTTAYKFCLIFVNHDGVYEIMKSWKKLEIIRMIKALERIENNLILK